MHKPCGAHAQTVWTSVNIGGMYVNQQALKDQKLLCDYIYKSSLSDGNFFMF
jgi:hypothetical protein